MFQSFTQCKVTADISFEIFRRPPCPIRHGNSDRLIQHFIACRVSVVERYGIDERFKCRSRLAMNLCNMVQSVLKCTVVAAANHRFNFSIVRIDDNKADFDRLRGFQYGVDKGTAVTKVFAYAVPHIRVR